MAELAANPRKTTPANRARTRSYRWGVTSRIAAALFGGYYVACASTAMLSVILPMSRINRVVTASLLSFVAWTVVALWVFAARSAWRGWWPLLVAGSAMLTLALAMRADGMRP